MRSGPRSVVLALDQGTTSSRAILFDAGGRVLGVAQREHPQSFPRPGWVEHDPEAIWETQSEVAAEAMRTSRIRPADVAAIGITNQRETTILWDRRTGRPVSPAIVWQDRRTAGLCARLKDDGAEERVHAATGLWLDPYFSATKIRWILDHVDGARRMADDGHLAFGTVDTWLLHRLTDGAVHATDPSNASRTLLYDLDRRDWDDGLCELFGVPRSLLPEVRATSGVFAEATAVAPGVPIAALVGDQQSALFGQTCFDPGEAKATYGTGCFLLQHAGARPKRSANGLLSTVAWDLGEGPEHAIEGSVFVGGAVVQWLRDGLGLVKSAPEVEALAAKVEDSGGVVLVPAFAGLGAPHWDPHARGLLIGITRGTTAAHVARAALEAIALQVTDLVDALRADTGLALPELHVDGGASTNDLLMQIQADLLGIPVVRSRVAETTSLGAGFLAGLATGLWKDRSELRALRTRDRVFLPAGSRDRVQELRARWKRAVERARGWEA